jgi:predicted NUDIX family NTP pyrophosphohydrolase
MSDVTSWCEMGHMPKRSAALLVHRGDADSLELLIVHPGGPFWAKKDEGAWSIPKGELDDDEESLACALREFEEELGQVPPVGDPVDLGTVKQKNGKVVHCWAVAGDLDVSQVTSNEIEIEWPPRSGQSLTIPEVDRAEWVTPEVARTKLNSAQAEFVDRLLSAQTSLIDDPLDDRFE